MCTKSSQLKGNTLLKIGLLILTRVITISEAEVTLTPSKQDIAENSPFTLTCSYTGSLTVSAYTMNVFRSSSQSGVLAGSLLADCSVFTKQPNTSFYEYNCPTSKQLSWTIKTVTRANDGEIWTCQLGFTTTGSEEAVFTINVQVPIQSVVMTKPTNNIITIQENKETVFVCKTSGGLPAATVRWFKDLTTATSGDVEITDFVTTTSSTIGDKIYVTSTLRYSPKKGDNGMKIYCTARNSAYALTSSRKPELNVQYSPDGPPAIQNFTYDTTCNIIENVQRTLSCSIVGGNPLATLSWICFNSGSASTTTGSTVSKTVVFTASRRKDRSCTCQSSHPVAGTQSVTVNVQVLYPPEGPTFKVNGNNVSSPVQFIIGRTRSVVCESIGKPKPNIYIWTKDGQKYSTGKTLTFNGIQRQDDSRYTCTAENTMIASDGSRRLGTNSSTVQVTVLYPPKLQGLSKKDIVSGSRLNLSCPYEKGNPQETTFKWTRNGDDKEWNDPILSIENVTKHDDMMYTCTVRNVMTPTGSSQETGEDSGLFHLNVLYQSTVLSFVVDGKVDSSSVTVSENYPLRFGCIIDSNPNSSVEIAFEDKVIYRQNYLKSVLYNYKAASCMDAGVYACTARNRYNYGNDSMAKLKLYVKCSPRPLHQIKLNFTGKLNNTVTLNLTTLAYPEPGTNGFAWYKQNSFTWVTLLSNADLLIMSSGLQTSLTIKRVFTSDFGHYRVTVKNDIGEYNQYLYLTEERHPTTMNTITYHDNSSLIVDVILGSLLAAITLYALVLTIYLKRKFIQREKLSTTSDKLTKTATYANLSYQADDSVEVFSRSLADETGASNQEKDDPTEQYTDLAHCSNDDQKTYDVIQML